VTERQKRGRDQGAALIFVLTVVTVLALATMTVAKFGFTVPEAAVEHTANQRVSDALESGLGAGVEAVRTNSTPGACPASSLILSDVDGLASGGVLTPITATVACATTANPHLLALTVTCNGSSGPTLVGSLSIADVGDDPNPPLLLTSRNFSAGTGSAGC
jgi:Tfp pilus assembly protein PilX